MKGLHGFYYETEKAVKNDPGLKDVDFKLYIGNLQSFQIISSTKAIQENKFPQLPLVGLLLKLLNMIFISPSLM